MVRWAGQPGNYRGEGNGLIGCRPAGSPRWPIWAGGAEWSATGLENRATREREGSTPSPAA